MLQCTSCGAQLADDSRFCHRCAAPVPQAGDTAPAETAAPLPVAPQGVQPATEKQEHIENTEHAPATEQKEETARAQQPPAQAEPAETTARTEQPPAHFCAKCGARLPQGCAYCLLCGTKAGEAPPPGNDEEPVPVPAASKQAAVPRQDSYDFFNRKTATGGRTASPRRRGLAVAAGVLALLLVVGVVGVWVWQLVPYLNTAGKSAAQNAVVYAQDGMLKFRTPVMEQGQVISASFDSQGAPAGDLVKSSADGRYLAYLNHYRPVEGHWANGKGDLFIYDLTRAFRPDAPRGEGVNIATGVTTDFAFSGNNAYVVYLTENGDLYAYDYLLAWRLDTDVKGIYAVGNEQVLYYKGNEGDVQPSGPRVDVYMRSLAQESDDKVRIDSDVHELLDWSSNFGRFTYLRNRWDAAAGAYRQDLCTYDAASNTHAVVEQNVARVVDASADADTAYYLVAERVRFSYEDFLNDDLAESDREIVEPDIDQYPLLAEFYRNYGEDSGMDAYTGSMDFEQISRQRALYERDIDAYAAKLARDDLRERLRAEIRALSYSDTSFYTLRRYHAGQATTLASRVYPQQGNEALDVSGNALAGYITYSVAEPERITPVNMSEIWEDGSADFDVLGSIWDNMPFSLCFAGGSAEPVRLFISGQALVPEQLAVTAKVDGIYFTLRDAQGGNELYYAPVNGGALGDATLLDKDVRLLDASQEFAGRLLYRKDENGDGAFDLYALRGGVRERIAYDIAAGPFLRNEGKTLFFFQQFDPALQTGELNMLVKDKKLVSANVQSFYYRRDNLVYLLCGGKDGAGDLYAYTGDEVVPIAANISGVYELVATPGATAPPANPQDA